MHMFIVLIYQHISGFRPLPRDSMLARVLAMTLCLSICLSVWLSVTSRSSIETDQQIELIFGIGASCGMFYSVFSGNSVSAKNKTTVL